MPCKVSLTDSHGAGSVGLSLEGLGLGLLVVVVVSGLVIPMTVLGLGLDLGFGLGFGLGLGSGFRVGVRLGNRLGLGQMKHNPLHCLRVLVRIGGGGGD